MCSFTQSEKLLLSWLNLLRGKTKQAETECALILNLKCNKGRGLWNQLVRLSSMTNFFLSSALKDFFLVPLNYWAVLESIS